VMAQALVENGDSGILYTVDSSYAGFEPIGRHPIHRFTKQRSDTALETLQKDGRRIDFTFIDGTISRRDVALLNAVKSTRMVIALHDYKPPADKGITNAWLLGRHLDGAAHCVWILPERQGAGYPVVEGVFVNSSVAVLLPQDVAQSLRTLAAAAP
jgi:hypothetical protein